MEARKNETAGLNAKRYTKEEWLEEFENMLRYAMPDGMNELALAIYSSSSMLGFWDNPRNVGEMFFLTVCELAEAYERFRKQRHNEPDDHVSDHPNMAVELGDAIIRLLDIAHGMGYDIGQAIADKMLYNINRPYMHGKVS